MLAAGGGTYRPGAAAEVVLARLRGLAELAYQAHTDELDERY
ncbi:hypothetical protein ACIRRA_44465 [Nocardia sp. NPDC101769]